MRSFKQHINEQAKTKIPAAKFEELIVIAFNGGFNNAKDRYDIEENLYNEYADVVEKIANDIIQNFRWLGIDWDEGVDVGGSHGEYKQSLRFDRYQEVADQLLSEGLAYEDDGAVRFKVPDSAYDCPYDD